MHLTPFFFSLIIYRTDNPNTPIIITFNEKENVECLRQPLEDILEEVEDLKTKKKTLLKLRRACLLKNNPNDL